MTDGFTIQVMNRAQLDIAVDWAAAEGWNPGLQDAGLFHAADPQGFLVGLQGGEPVACISVVRYGHRYGFLGFYIVAPGWRGKGRGFAVWEAGLQHLRGRTVGLDGVLAQQDNYRKSGFKLAHRNIRYGGAADFGAPAAGLVDAREIAFDRLLEYDRRFFPAPRDGFVSGWLTAPGHRALAALADGELAGLGVIRPCRQGHKIGPLYAATSTQARALLAGLCASITGPVWLDVPETNAAAVTLAESLGMKPDFETARMYKGVAPQVEMARLYGITTFELG
ncbi:GNAT family N-acetyltransferase [Ferrovibrio terrae]|uniref:GNAT family N-acetyltransferase n=1 Tax=Ferrovibrio terrae TaxID=2594003 RepID=A0A516H3N8_9PROT|nr:GNAT family N-acetyltransferase [Ferrovibrio terrae]QDO98355.1 GNAT family N-acetyltransferase [Ferrovibrio terrae]